MLKHLRMDRKHTKAIWWALIVLTVVSFVGGFIFLFGSGIGDGSMARVSGAVAVVNGSPITSTEFQNALAQQREMFRRQFSAEPAEEDNRTLEAQAMRALITQRLFDRTARQVKLAATDREVVLLMQTSPPEVLVSSPEFQTDGKFDPQKYAVAMRNPGNNWAPFEQMARNQLPQRKLQERLAASIKLSQGELVEEFRNRFERVSAAVVHLPPVTSAPVPAPADSTLQRIYDLYKDRFSAPATVDLEALRVPKRYSDEELRSAREQARGIADRARRGEDFGTLAKDYSEGSGADKGGELSRMFMPAEFGPELGPKISALPKGGVSDPYQEGGRFTVFKVLDRVGDTTSANARLRLAQIVVKARPAPESVRDQYEELKKLQGRAKRTGLGRAAAEAGQATVRTGPFSFTTTPPQLYGAPEALEWGIGAKQGSVSPVFEGLDEFVIAQVASQRDAGPLPRADVAEQLKQIAELEARVAAVKGRVDQVAAGLRAGQTLEQAGAAAGVSAFRAEGMSRVQPDPRLGGLPELIGAIFGAPPSKVVGPMQTLGGWYFFRVDGRTAADTTMLSPQLRGQISNDVLQRRQQEFFMGWLGEQRRRAKVQDLRQP